VPCYHPIDGFRGADGSLVFSRSKGTGLPMRVPCGRCIGCRLERSRQWAVRCMHEASLHDRNSFITLTYDNDHLPRGGSLVKVHFQKFMKRLRREAGKVRFFHCGEYGDRHHRPHYHALLFGLNFPDSLRIEDSFGGHPQWMSPLLSKVWSEDKVSIGRATIGELNFESAAYVARYSLKKKHGKRAEAHYERVDSESGELFQAEPEYATMSRRPGIGRGWIEKFSSDVFPSDELVVRGSVSKPPRYYDEYYKARDPGGFEEIKRTRAKGRQRGDETPARLSVREVCATARANLFKRRLEEC